MNSKPRYTQSLLCTSYVDQYFYEPQKAVRGKKTLEGQNHKYASERKPVLTSAIQDSTGGSSPMRISLQRLLSCCVACKKQRPSVHNKASFMVIRAKPVQNSTCAVNEKPMQQPANCFKTSTITESTNEIYNIED